MKLTNEASKMEKEILHFFDRKVLQQRKGFEATLAVGYLSSLLIGFGAYFWRVL